MKKLAFTSNFLIPDELSKVIDLLGQLEALHFKKDISSLEATAYLEAIPPHLLTKIVLHTHHHLATTYKVAGLHINEPQRNSGMMGGISTSCHRLEDLTLCSKNFEYVFFSPIFPSISKENYLPKYSLEEISSFIKKKKLSNIIALGGISPDKVELLEKMGFAGVAMLGYFWK